MIKRKSIDNSKIDGLKIYKMDIKLKHIKSESCNLKDEEGGMDMSKGSSYPGVMKFHKGKLFLEYIRSKSNGRKG